MTNLDSIEAMAALKPSDLTAAADQSWEVVVVGAGPAGAMAALHLAKRGHRTLLLDKDSFPRDKVCGDGLIADSVRCLARAGLYDVIRSSSRKSDVGTIYSPSRVCFDVPGEFLTLKRVHFDALILKRAVEYGAVFCRAKVTGVEVQPNSNLLVSLDGAPKPLHARIVFLATGANVEMPSRLGLVTQQQPSGIALRCYVRSPVELDRLVVSYDRSITPGYAWIFPLADGEFNIGCGVNYRQGLGARVNLREAFKSFLESFPLAAEIVRHAEAISPVRGAMLRCGLIGTKPLGPGHTLVLGESIGATFPFTGEGIGKAMETGEIAAEVADEALRSGDFERLRDFPRRIEHELKPKFLGYRIAENWFSRPWLNDFVARRIRRSRILQELVAGIVNETVDPREVFSLRGMIRSFVS